MGSQVSYDLQGQGVFVVLNPTFVNNPVSEATGVRWIQCVTDCVFLNLGTINHDVYRADQLTDMVIPAGTGIGGQFTTVTITSGVAICYKI